MAGTGRTSVRSYNLYAEGTTVMGGTYAQGEVDFLDSVDGTPFRSHGVMIANDNAALGADILFSFDGVTLHGRAKPQEKIAFDFRVETKIYLKSTAASAYRLWAW